MREPVFILRCRVCGKEFETEWGPEVHSESARALQEHILTHSFLELMDYTMRQHSVTSREA